MNVFRPHYRDVFNPLLTESESLPVIQEQKDAIMAILEVACSDSAFAKKAYAAINFILTSGAIVVPVVTSLNPSTAVIGDPSFDLHVMGTGFTPQSVIVFAGFEEPTTFVSDSELTTGVNMDMWAGADSIPVSVSNPLGTISEPTMFTFTSPALQSAVGMGGTFHPAPSHSLYIPVPELKEHHTIKSAKEEANAKHTEGKK